MARVELRDVVKRYGKVVAVDHVNLKIGDGEFFTLLGPSGCGKTTTLRLVAGLEIPDEGEILIDDRVVNDLHPRDRDVAMVFQNYALYPHMTVFENIAFPLLARKKQLKLSDEEIKKMVLETAKFLGIEDLLDRYPGQLSGGQQQRVALARALVRKPKVWLLDEPLSNLDAKLRVVMRSELKKIQKTLGITTIYVTHDQVEAMAMSDRIAVMNKGKVLQVGTPDDLYYRPADTFVATFIGSPPMNLVPCVVEEIKPLEFPVPPGMEGGIAGAGLVRTTYALRCPGDLIVPLDPAIGERVKSEGSTEVLLGIRPEHVILTKEEPKVKVGYVKGRIEIIQPLGSELIVDIKVGDEYVKARRPPAERYSVGDEINLVVNLKYALLFDAKRGSLLV